MKQSFLNIITNKLFVGTANIFYGNPSNDIFTIVITGTNGKTTTGLILNYLLNKSVGKSALLTPDFCAFGDNKVIKKTRFTPMGINSFLAEAKGNGCQVAIFIFDTISISRGLLNVLNIDMGILTNVKTDKDDEIDCYKQLFIHVITNNKQNKIAILPKDDKVGNNWYNNMTFGKVMNYGIIGNANLKADNILVQNNKTEFLCTYLGQKFNVSTSISGEHNITHLLSAMSAMIVIGVPIVNLLPILQNIPSDLVNIPQNYNKNGVNRYFESSQNPDIVFQTGNYCKDLHKGGNLFVVDFLNKKNKTDLLENLLENTILLGGKTLIGLDNIGDQEIFDNLKPVWFKLSHKIGDDLFYFNSKKILLNRVYKNSKIGDVILINGRNNKDYKQIIDNF